MRDIAFEQDERHWDFLDNIRGMGFDIYLDVAANGTARVLLEERGSKGNSWGCESPTRTEAYTWIGKKVEQMIAGRPEMVRMADKAGVGT